jgi:hypothetical protein
MMYRLTSDSRCLSHQHRWMTVTTMMISTLLYLLFVLHGFGSRQSARISLCIARRADDSSRTVSSATLLHFGSSLALDL